MIRDLLAELERGGSGIGVESLARRLSTTPAAIEGALELLARKGRLVRAGASAGRATAVRRGRMCNPLMGQTTSYIPVPAGARALPIASGEAGGACTGARQAPGHARTPPARCRAA